MKIRNVYMGEMVTKVSPTLKSLKLSKSREGEVEALSEWIAQQYIMHLYAPNSMEWAEVIRNAGF